MGWGRITELPHADKQGRNKLQDKDSFLELPKILDTDIICVYVFYSLVFLMISSMFLKMERNWVLL